MTIRILLAEDNPGDVLLVRRALEEHRIQHELHVVKNGGEALDFVAGIGQPGGPPRPDLILLDLNLPKADGASILTELRKNPDCAQTPVIAVTSSDAQKDRARMAELGIRHYFRKPTDFYEFMRLGEIVRAVIQQSQP